MKLLPVIGIATVGGILFRNAFMRSVADNVAIDFRLVKLNFVNSTPVILVNLLVFNNTPYQVTVTGVTSNVFYNDNKIGIINAKSNDNNKVKIAATTSSTIPLQIILLHSGILNLLLQISRGEKPGIEIKLDTTLYTSLGRITTTNKMSLGQ